MVGASEKQEKYRVIVWGVGVVGSDAVRICQEKKSVAVVGAIDNDRAKVGKDLGDVVGLGKKLGVIVSDDVDRVLKTPADAVLHLVTSSVMGPEGWGTNAEEIVRALKAKKNVITTTGFIYPWRHSPEMSQMLDLVAKENNVTLVGTGITPGFNIDFLPLVLSGIYGRVDRIKLRRAPNHTHYQSHHIMVETFGYGLTPAEHDRKVRQKLEKFMYMNYIESVHMMAAALGWELTDIRTTLRTHLAKEPLTMAMGEVKPGTVCSFTYTMEGLKGEDAVIQIEYNGAVCPEKVAEAGPRGVSLWVEGLPSLGLQFSGDFGPQPERELGRYATAAHAVNYIPVVVQAPPGLKSMIDLPPATALP